MERTVGTGSMSVAHFTNVRSHVDIVPVITSLAGLLLLNKRLSSGRRIASGWSRKAMKAVIGHNWWSLGKECITSFVL
jgi:hypothetical protein